MPTYESSFQSSLMHIITSKNYQKDNAFKNFLPKLSLKNSNKKTVEIHIHHNTHQMNKTILTYALSKPKLKTPSRCERLTHRFDRIWYSAAKSESAAKNSSWTVMPWWRYLHLSLSNNKKALKKNLKNGLSILFDYTGSNSKIVTDIFIRPRS